MVTLRLNECDTIFALAVPVDGDRAKHREYKISNFALTLHARNSAI